MHKTFPLPGESSHWQYKFLLLVKVVSTARRLEMPLPEVCTVIDEMMKKLPVKDRWQLHLDSAPCLAHDSSCNYQGRIKDQDLFGVHDLDGDEVFMDFTIGKNVEQDATVAESVKGIVAITTPQISKDKLTLAQTLMEIKAPKPKAKGVTNQDPSKFRTVRNEK
nr:hypothetical protein [Tanacetum cinerariifolium]